MVLKQAKGQRRWWGRNRTKGAKEDPPSEESTHPIQLKPTESRQDAAMPETSHENSAAGMLDSLLSGVIDAFDVAPTRNDDGGLHTVCRKGNLKAVKTKVKASPRSIMAFHRGGTPLYHAVLSGNKRVVAYLLKHGAYDRGGVCMQVAESPEIRKMLLDDLKQKRRNDELPLVDKYDVACSNAESSFALTTGHDDGWNSCPDWDYSNKNLSHEPIVELKTNQKKVVAPDKKKVNKRQAAPDEQDEPKKSAMEQYRTDNSFANSSTYTEDFNITQESAKFDQVALIVNLDVVRQDIDKHRNDEDEDSQATTTTSSNPWDTEFINFQPQEKDVVRLDQSLKSQQTKSHWCQSDEDEDEDGPFVIISCCE